MIIDFTKTSTRKCRRATSTVALWCQEQLEQQLSLHSILRKNAEIVTLKKYEKWVVKRDEWDIARYVKIHSSCVGCDIHNNDTVYSKRGEDMIVPTYEIACAFTYDTHNDPLSESGVVATLLKKEEHIYNLNNNIYLIEGKYPVPYFDESRLILGIRTPVTVIQNGRCGRWGQDMLVFYEIGHVCLARNKGYLKKKGAM